MGKKYAGLLFAVLGTMAYSVSANAADNTGAGSNPIKDAQDACVGKSESEQCTYMVDKNQMSGTCKMGQEGKLSCSK